MKHVKIFRFVFLGLGLCAAILTSGCSRNSSDGSLEFTGVMTGDSVVPPISTPNSGTFTAIVTADKKYVDITIVHDVPDVTLAHMHGPAPEGENGPVIFDLLANGTVTPVRSERGNSQVMIEARFSEVTDNFLNDLGASLIYLQIHSQTHPAGHLRGQLTNNPSQSNDEIDVDVTKATMTVVESLALSQIRRNGAKVGIHNLTNAALNGSSTFPVSVIPFVFSGPEVAVTSPDKTGNSTLTTNIPPLNTRNIEVQLTQIITQSFTRDLVMVLSSGLLSPIEAILHLEVIYRQAAILAYLEQLHIALGGIPFLDATIPRLGSVPILRRLLSTGQDSSIAARQSLIILIAPRILDPKTRGITDPFPCGPITDGLVICPEDQAATNFGSRLVLTMVLDDMVPLADPVNSYQYGFVFDSDGITGNNFEPDPAFPEDFFQGTDKWYFINYSPTGGWQFFAVDASGDGFPARVLTDAKFIIKGNAIMLTVPQTEFVLDTPGFRTTAFRHTGDFGANGDFELSYHPGLDEPLEPTALP